MLALGLLVAAAIPAAVIYSNSGKTASTAIIPFDPKGPAIPPGRFNLLGKEPEPIVYSDRDINSQWSYDKAGQRLIVDSPRWSIFACGEHPEDVSFDVAARHVNPPGVAGVFWGLHSEASENGSTQTSCLVATAAPDSEAPENSLVNLYQFTIKKNGHGQVDIETMHSIGEESLRLDWTASVDLKLRLRDGRPLHLLVQGTLVDLSKYDSAIDWQPFSTGHCGLVASNHRIVFTRGLLEMANRQGDN